MREEYLNSSRKKVIITGGGTAGHIYPALSIIEYIREKYSETEICFIGSKRGMERRIIGETGIRLETIATSGLNRADNFFRRFIIYLRFFCFLVFGLFASIRIIWNFKPDFILGTGGYVCGPVFLAGKLLGKEIVLHEQNFIPGRLNRFFAKYSKFIFTSFEGSEEFFGLEENDKRKKIIFSGNPVRHSIREFMYKTRDFNRFGLEKDRFTIIAFGGSLGAEKINNSVSGLYKYFRDSKNIQFLLICGHRFYDGIKKVLDGFKKPSDKLIFRLFPYIKDMAELYRVTDLIVSRAGATTIAELYFTGIPSILVPYPEAIADHQFYNANYLVDPGKAIMIPDKDLNEIHLYKMIKKILSNKKEKYISMKNTDIKKLKMESEAVIVEKSFTSIHEAKY